MEKRNITELMAELKILEEDRRDCTERANALTNDINKLSTMIEDHGKPVLVDDQVNQLRELIESAIENYCFERDEFDVELCLEYDNTIEIDNVTFQNHDNLAEFITEKVLTMFNEQEV